MFFYSIASTPTQNRYWLSSHWHLLYLTFVYTYLFIHVSTSRLRWHLTSCHRKISIYIDSVSCEIKIGNSKAREPIKSIGNSTINRKTVPFICRLYLAKPKSITIWNLVKYTTFICNTIAQQTMIDLLNESCFIKVLFTGKCAFYRTQV